MVTYTDNPQLLVLLSKNSLGGGNLLYAPDYKVGQGTEASIAGEEGPST